VSRNAIIVHGKPSREDYYNPAEPSPSNDHWLPWLAKQLLVCDILAVTPEMPRAYAPDYPLWTAEFERFPVGPQTLLVGHSCGAGFLVRWLSEHPDVRVDRVVLVAPWLDVERTGAPEFFEFTLDPGLAARAGRFVVFNSDNDSEHVQRSARLLRDSVPGLVYRDFHSYGHFCHYDMGGPEFPELLDVLVP
jgi:predicted alpha/beta hydrolase family esterase